MACDAIPESIPVHNAGLVAPRPWKVSAGLVGLSEKQYQASAGLARNCRFFLSSSRSAKSRKLGMSVLIEGVETAKQLRMIETLGTIAEAQGYLFSLPIPGIGRKGTSPVRLSRSGGLAKRRRGVALFARRGRVQFCAPSRLAGRMRGRNRSAPRLF
jgi:hypothetical protein